MKTRFIRIESTSDIDTSKITVHDLNNRYIDQQGNMYGLRYNRKTRRIEFIKLIRTTTKSANYYQQQVSNYKKNETIRNNHIEIQNNINAVDLETEEDDEIDEEIFDPKSFINNTIDLMQTHIERLNGIMMNIRNSKVFSEDDRVTTNLLNDIFRNIDIDGIQRIDKTIANHKELKNYPRSLSFYLSKLDTNSRKIINDLTTDSIKMDYIYFLEMYNSVKNLYRTLDKIIKELYSHLQDINLDELKELTYVERQRYIDAKISVENTIKDISRLLRKLKKMDEFLSNPSNI